MKGLSERNLYLRYADAAQIRTLVTRDLGRGIVGISRIRCDFDDLGMLDSPDREDAYLVILRLTDAQEDLWVDGRHVATSSPFAGTAGVLDYRQEWRAYIHTRFDALNFHVPRAVLKALDGDEHRRTSSELHVKPGMFVEDPVIRALSSAMIPALDNPEQVNALFLDHIGCAFVAHLSRTYGQVAPITRQRGRRLARWQVRRATEMIDENLGNDLRLADLAEACGVSISHFSHAFRESMAMPPHRWLLHRRIERAKALMLRPGLSLAEIAVQCGFSDQSHFTRAFRRIVGVTPSSWRRDRSPRASHA
ncbi:helix-turn-helix domain-containing protein [Sorangium sp. So ce233]|uniref:helix-turn-helix domain-containing protein n=1 Tax=Sorangium sp. So ce233 TaxID=3133290 RepID=UPI003F6066DA